MATSDPGQKTVIIASDREYTFNPGDLLTFYAQDSERLGTARIVKMYSVEEPKEVTGKTSRVAGAVKYDDADFMKVSTLCPSPSRCCCAESCRALQHLCCANVTAIMHAAWYLDVHQGVSIVVVRPTSACISTS